MNYDDAIVVSCRNATGSRDVAIHIHFLFSIHGSQIFVHFFEIRYFQMFKTRKYVYVLKPVWNTTVSVVKNMCLHYHYD